MGCAAGLAKILLFVVNFIFVAAGLALLILGVLYKLNVSEVSDVTPDGLEAAPLLLIIIGSIVFVISFFGCCGAVRESTCMLTTYAVILLVIFILQVAVGVYAFLQIRDMDGLKTEFRNALQTTFDRYATDPVAKETIDAIQRGYKCCGLDKPGPIVNNSTYALTCCHTLVNDRCTSENTFERGCFEVLFDFVVNAVKIIGIVAIAVAATEIFGSIAALCLSSSIKNQYRRGAYA